MDKHIELVVTDLDGTLWDEHGVLSNATLAALAELAAMEIPVLAATARGVSATFETFDRLDISLPAILCNGALGKLEDGSTTFHRLTFSASLAQELLSLFMEFDLVPHLGVDHPEYCDLALRGASSCPSFDAQCRQGLRTATLGEVPDHDVTQLRVIGVDRDRLAEIAQIFLARTDLRTYFVEDTVFGGWSLELAPFHADKWAGVISYCAARDLDPSAVLGIGDGVNDIGFLSNSRIAIAMPHSHPGVQAVAHDLLHKGEHWSAVLRYV